MWIYYQSLKIMYLNKTLIHISGYILYSAKTIQNQDKPDLNQRTYQLPNFRFILNYKNIMIGFWLTKDMEGCVSWTPTLSAETETEKKQRKEKSMIGAAIVELKSSESEKNISLGLVKMKWVKEKVEDE